MAERITETPKTKVLIDAIKIAYHTGSFGLKGSQWSLIKKFADPIKKDQDPERCDLLTLTCQLKYNQLNNAIKIKTE